MEEDWRLWERQHSSSAPQGTALFPGSQCFQSNIGPGSSFVLCGSSGKDVTASNLQDKHVFTPVAQTHSMPKCLWDTFLMIGPRGVVCAGGSVLGTPSGDMSMPVLCHARAMDLRGACG